MPQRIGIGLRTWKQIAVLIIAQPSIRRPRGGAQIGGAFEIEYIETFRPGDLIKRYHVTQGSSLA